MQFAVMRVACGCGRADDLRRGGGYGLVQFGFFR